MKVQLVEQSDRLRLVYYDRHVPVTQVSFDINGNEIISSEILLNFEQSKFIDIDDTLDPVRNKSQNVMVFLNNFHPSKMKSYCKI